VLLPSNALISLNADDFRDYMLSFLFLRYLSGNYEESAKKELGADYPQVSNSETNTPLALWYEQNQGDAHNSFSVVVDSGNNSGLKPYSFIKFSSTVLKCSLFSSTISCGLRKNGYFSWLQ
jgi:hypothetical protein